MRWYQLLQVEPSENERLSSGQLLANSEESQPSTFKPSTFNGLEPEPELIKVGQRVWAWIRAFGKWGQGVVSAILPVFLGISSFRRMS
jgi:hypothetical protein